ncbi:hypothetical protein [Pedobacter sp. MW01-1-1]|uniref:hypothetical protein n=1 Tax=Pedobacter sp. MW01-1-1 TaxID=3383027 RepID=UPI003FEF3269
MKKITTFLIILSTVLIACAQTKSYPGKLEIRGYKIGDMVDTTFYKKQGDLYFPNHLDGWTMNNVDKLPEKYKGLPVAIWQLKSDSSIVLTLLNNIIMNITVSYLKEAEKEKLSKMLTERFGTNGKEKSYEQTHPFQSWITYWDLKTWETNDVIFQLGTSDMRKANDPIPKNVLWNLVYSDFILENKIINEYKEK